jgi:phosphonate transport system permease protein
LVVTDSGAADLVSAKTWSNAGNFIRQLIGVDSPTQPAYLVVDRWLVTGRLALDTLAMSVLTGVAVLPTFLPGARNVSNGDLGGAPSRLGTLFYHVLRLAFTLTRAVPELVWAMVIVFFLSPGIVPGAVALAVHNYGVVGRLSAEVVENLDPGPAKALRSAGASNLQMLIYSIFPQALPHFLTYLLYRWEVIIRTTVVVGFVSAGGLGREFRLSLSFFHYTDLALLIMWYLILVIAVDLLSAWLRRLVTGKG